VESMTDCIQSNGKQSAYYFSYSPYSFDREQNDWSKLRTMTVSNLHSEWRDKRNHVTILSDSKFEGDELALVKWKEFSSLQKRYEDMRAELRAQKETAKKYKATIELIQEYLDSKNGSDTNLLRKLLALI